MLTSEMIGKKIEYETGGRTYQARIVDKITILRTDREGQESAFDLYLVALPDGQVYKISPVTVKKILP